MYYAKINKRDIANGIGIRVSLFVSGCTRNCKGCFNKEAWDFKFGEPFTEETENLIIEYLSPDYVDGLTLLGGDPFEIPNQKALLPFIKRVKEIYPNKTIWAYTGFVLEEHLLGNGIAHCEATDELLGLTDILVDGPFIEEQKDISLQFKGSHNQRIIDLKKTLSCGKICTWNS